MGDVPLILHVEACQRRESSLSASEIEKELDRYLKQQTDLVLNRTLRGTILPSHLKYVTFCSDDETYKVNLTGRTVKKFYHVYQTWDEGCQTDTLSGELDDVPASINWCLPNSAFEGMWESLILEDGLKERLMSYVQTTLLYSGKQVSSHIVHWNGILLFHGPPGTGKTTLCKALAQKLSIRLSTKYRTCQLVEINSHSLFSKWFSESAKLVLKLFTTIREWLQSNDHFVCILIDEVESLTHVRKANGTEPSDSIRVVNAVLTQIDQLQRYPNFLILSTSNVTHTIDMAFADRADLKLYIPYPTTWATYEIYKSCLEELITCGLIKGTRNDFFEGDIFQRIRLESEPEDSGTMSELMENSKRLYNVCQVSYGLSGRTLRKMPFLASATFVNKEVPTVTEFLDALHLVVEKHNKSNDLFSPPWDKPANKNPGYYLSP